MEKIANKTIDVYLSKLKEDIHKKVLSIGLAEKNPHDSNSLMQYVFDYEKLELCKEDFIKRKWVKNVICGDERCNAKRASGEQCTRRRKDDCHYCGTHLKGIPHGNVECDNKDKKKDKKVEVFAQDIKGIIYYLDNDHNVYNTEHIVANKKDPEVIAKYEKHGDIYTIPSFNL